MKSFGGIAQQTFYFAAIICTETRLITLYAVSLQLAISGNLTVWMLSACKYAHMQHVVMLLCGNPDPGPEEQGCCLCAFGNMWQEDCAAILVEKKRDALHLTTCHHLTSCHNQLRHLLSLQQRRALHIWYINWKIYSDYHLGKQFCLYLDELTQVFPPTLGNLDHSQTWSTSETHYPAHRCITLLPLITLSWQE